MSNSSGIVNITVADVNEVSLGSSGGVWKTINKTLLKMEDGACGKIFASIVVVQIPLASDGGI